MPSSKEIVSQTKVYATFSQIYVELVKGIPNEYGEIPEPIRVGRYLACYNMVASYAMLSGHSMHCAYGDSVPTIPYGQAKLAYETIRKMGSEDKNISHNGIDFIKQYWLTQSMNMQWGSCGDLFHKILTLLGLSEDTLLHNFPDKTYWLDELPNPYAWLVIQFCTDSSYKVEKRGDILISGDAILENTSGSGLIIGPCILRNSGIYGSIVNGSNIKGSYMETCLLHNCKLSSTDTYRSSIFDCTCANSTIRNSWIGDISAEDTCLDRCVITPYWSRRKAVTLKVADVYNRMVLTDGEVDAFIEEYCKKFRLDNTVHNYSNREAGELPRMGKGRFICGIELEILSQQPLVYKPSYCRVKHDGSLSSGGVEIATRPDSMDSHLRNIGRMFAINRRKNVLSADETCGMHIHVPKSACRWGAIKDRIYNRKAKYYRIAGREENSYCIYSRHAGRYQAVNSTGDATVEFRLFSGTVSLHKIRRRLQWVEAICKWSKKLSPEQRKELSDYKVPTIEDDAPNPTWVNQGSVWQRYARAYARVTPPSRQDPQVREIVWDEPTPQTDTNYVFHFGNQSSQA